MSAIKDNQLHLYTGTSIELEFRQNYYDKHNHTIIIQTHIPVDGVIPDAAILTSIHTGDRKIFWIKDILTASIEPPIQIGNYIHHDMGVNLQIQYYI